MKSPLLSAEVKVLAFAGSTRSDSYNKKLIHEAADIERQLKAEVTVIDLRDYPMPFASPEYNSSISGVLKNTLDWDSRSEKGGPSREAFKGKRFGLMSASPSPREGIQGLVHLREVIEDAGGTVGSKQVTIPNAPEYFSKQDRVENPLFKRRA